MAVIHNKDHPKGLIKSYFNRFIVLIDIWLAFEANVIVRLFIKMHFLGSYRLIIN